MAFVFLIAGIVLVVAAIRGTEGALFQALGTDVPGFAIWAAAIIAIGVVGFIPGLRAVSRGLLALVIFVLILKNYAGILGGFQNAWQGAAAQGQAGEAAASGSNSSSGSAGGLTILPQVGQELGSAFAGVLP